jgi:hypothetical protein
MFTAKWSTVRDVSACFFDTILFRFSLQVEEGTCLMTSLYGPCWQQQQQQTATVLLTQAAAHTAGCCLEEAAVSSNVLRC